MAWKFKQIEPQPARGVLRKEMWESDNWVAEEKYDGDRRIAQFCGKVVRFTGRRKSVDGSGFVEKTDNVPHLSASYAVPFYQPPPDLDGTVLDGEMIFNAENLPNTAVDGGRSKYVTSIMGSLPEEAVRKQIERGWLQYVVFDCLFWQGKDIRDLTWEERRKWTIKAVNAWKNPYVVATVATGYEKLAFYNVIIRRGGEGVILKHVDHVYGDKNGWVKVKKQDTADVVIIGYKAAKEISKKSDGRVSRTKYAGKVGSVEIGQFKNGKITSVGYARGFSDRLMDEFTKNGKRYLDQVIRIEHNGREPTGKFRHPRVCDAENPFRKDKAAQDCVLDLNER